MDKHEQAMKTYEIIQKRKAAKKQKELQLKLDLSETGWNGFRKYMNKKMKRYY